MAIVFLLTQIDGGAAAVVDIAGTAGKLRIFNWGPSLAESGLPTLLTSLLTDPNLLVLAT